jgi:hypothetical protein
VVDVLQRCAVLCCALRCGAGGGGGLRGRPHPLHAWPSARVRYRAGAHAASGPLVCSGHPAGLGAAAPPDAAAVSVRPCQGGSARGGRRPSAVHRHQCPLSRLVVQCVCVCVCACARACACVCVCVCARHSCVCSVPCCHRWGEGWEELQAGFEAHRASWLEQDRAGWLSRNQPYPGMVEAMRDCQYPVYFASRCVLWWRARAPGHDRTRTLRSWAGRLAPVCSGLAAAVRPVLLC